MRKRIILIFALIMMLISLGGFSIYAYFSGLFNVQNQQITYEHNANEIVIKNMNEFNDKINELNQLSIRFYVYSDDVSTNPVSLKLDTGVVLTATKDIWITADCNINLNGGSINLNGYRLIIRHAYAGQIVITNGNITSALGAASILIDAPNSNVVFDATLGDNVTKVEQPLNSELLNENALDYAYQQIANANGDFLKNLYVSNTYQQHFTCSLDDIVTSSCIYQLIGNDLDLLNCYYDIPITYVSSDETVLSSKGNVLKVGTVSLKMTVGSQSKELNIHILNNDQIPYGSIYSLLQNLSSYYDTTDGVYDFGGEILLPLTNDYFVNKNYLYKVYEEDTTNAIATSNELFTYFEKPNLNGEFIIFKFSNNLKYLGIEVDGVEVQIPIKGTSSGIHIDNNTYAKYIVYRNYGKGILIEGKKSADGTISYSYSSNPLGNKLCTYLNYNGDESNPYQVKYNGIQYKIVNDIDNVYSLDKLFEEDANGISVLKTASIEIKKQPTAQIAYLEITIDFDNGLQPSTVVTSIPIWYKEVAVDESGESQTVSSFRPYYQYFNREILNASEGYTYKSFEFPFTYNSNYPLYWVDFELKNDDPNVVLDSNLFTIKFELKYASETPMEFTNYEEYKQYVNSLSAENRKKLLDTRPYFQAIIREDLIPLTNTTVTLRYHYSFVEDGILDENGENMWHDFDVTEGITTFVICGIVRNDASGIPNTKLYQTVYDLYKVVEEEYIIYDWLDAEKESLSFENEAAIDNYKGIEYLTGLKKLNMKNCGISGYDVNKFGTLAGYLSKMTSLEELNLANNGIKDRDAMSNIITFPTGTDNGFVEKLSALTNLKVLHLEDNKIYQFRGIQTFESLEKVYVYNNSFHSEWSFLDDLLGVNDIYGSAGEINQAYYVQIYTKNVTIMWKYENNKEVPFEPTASSSKFTSLINSLMNLEYQYMIPEGQDISMVYNHLSTNTTDYSEETLSNSRGDRVGVDKIEFVPVLENGATNSTTTQFRAVYTYDFFYDGGLFGGGEGEVKITIDMVYEVERIAS